ncbi:MAG: hypothetical protein GY760_01860 [Deltaproteobacteria bacterium]|jgi:hypothetical protein|nr:hypothetical protein [Deltaproteobacteria bacterium]|tara:strand:- start:415 stop:720 length:306 start_codon:yes stop_codon:yes gene_type:complete
MKNDFKHKINCLKFSIGDRFELSISDVGRGGGACWKEVLIWDAEFQSEISDKKGGFRDDFDEGCLGVNGLHEVILKAVRHCNSILMDEMIEEGDERFITLD